MKSTKNYLLLLFFCIPFLGKAQEYPSIQTTESKEINLNEGVIVLNFWATWCGPCLKELEAINQGIEDGDIDDEVQVIAVSIDDARTSKRVKSMVRGKAWDFEIVLDPNQDLKRQFNVLNPPYTFVLKDGKIVFEHVGYRPGDEEELFDTLSEL